MHVFRWVLEKEVERSLEGVLEHVPIRPVVAVTSDANDAIWPWEGRAINFLHIISIFSSRKIRARDHLCVFSYEIYVAVDA